MFSLLQITMNKSKKKKRGAEITYLLPSNQEQTALFAIQDLSRDNVQEQQITPAVVQQLHLVTHLGAESKS